MDQTRILVLQLLSTRPSREMEGIVHLHTATSTIIILPFRSILDCVVLILYPSPIWGGGAQRLLLSHQQT